MTSAVVPVLLRPAAYVLLLMGLLGLGVSPCVAADEEPADPLEATWHEVDVLEDLLDDPDTPQGDLARQLELLVARTEELTQQEAGLAPAADAVKERARRARRRSLERLQGDVIDLLLEGLTETSLDARGQNVQEALNIVSARLLGRVPRFLPDQADRDRLSRRILRKLRWMERARHPIDVKVYEGAFVALARLGSDRAVAWMIDEQIHARKQPEEVARLGAALRALREVDPMSPRTRFELFEELRRRFVAVESLAAISSTDVNVEAARRFWDQVRTDVIALAQHVSRYPGGEDGVAYSTMGALADWFRDHDDMRRAPWTPE